MVSFFILSCGFLWSMLFGCSSESYVPVTNTIIQTSQHDLSADLAATQAELDKAIASNASREEIARIQHSTDVLRIEQQVAKEAEITQRNLDTQRFIMANTTIVESLKSERHNGLMATIVYASCAIALVAVIAVVVLGGGSWQSGETQRPTGGMIPVRAERFRAQIERQPDAEWSVVRYKGGETVGTDPNGNQWLIVE